MTALVDPVEEPREPRTYHGLNAIAQRQHGLVATRQLRQLGVSAAAETRLVARGVLAYQRRGVLVVPGAPADTWRECAAACLAGGDGVAATHFAGAGLRGFPNILAGAVELTVLGRASQDLSDVKVHETNRPFDIEFVKGIPTTPVARTLSDLAGCVHPTLLEECVAFAKEHRLCDFDDVRAEQGRRGRRALLAALDRVEEGAPDLQGIYRRILKRSGLPPWVEEFQVTLDGVDMSIDFAWPPWRVGLETKGFGPHTTRTQFDKDAEREGAALVDSWRLLWATTKSVPATVIRRLGRLLSLSP